MKRIWASVAAAGVLVAGAAVVVVLLVTGDAKPTAATCENGVSVYFADDDAMRAAAAKLRDDDRVGDIVTETRAQAKARAAKLLPAMDLGDTEVTAPALHLAAEDVSAAELRDLTGADAAGSVRCGLSREQREQRLAELSPELSCRQPVRIYFPDDDALSAALDVAREDPRVERATGETQKESFARFTKLYAEQPQLLAQIRPESLPAILTVEAAEGTDPKKLRVALTKSLPGARQGQANADFCLGLPHPVAK